MRLLNFGTVILPEESGEHSLPITARSGLINLPNGAFDQDGGRLVLGVSKISYRAKATSLNGNIDETLAALLKEVGKGRGILRALMRDGSTRLVTYAKMTGVTRIANADMYPVEQPVTITFEQDYPYWMNDSDGFFFDSGHFFDSGEVFDGKYDDITVTASPTTYAINNDGTAIVPMGTVTIKPNAASSLTNPKITNLQNGMSFQYTGTIAALSSLVIDFLTKTVELDGSPALGLFSLSGSKQVDYMLLELGTNNLQITGSVVGTTHIYWQWKRHYL